MFVHFFSLSTEIMTATLRALWRLNQKLGKISQYKKDVHSYALQFCIQANFLSVHLLRRYECFKK